MSRTAPSLRVSISLALSSLLASCPLARLLAHSLARSPALSLASPARLLARSLALSRSRALALSRSRALALSRSRALALSRCSLSLARSLSSRQRARSFVARVFGRSRSFFSDSVRGLRPLLRVRPPPTHHHPRRRDVCPPARLSFMPKNARGARGPNHAEARDAAAHICIRETEAVTTVAVLHPRRPHPRSPRRDRTQYHRGELTCATLRHRIS